MMAAMAAAVSTASTLRLLSDLADVSGVTALAGGGVVITAGAWTAGVVKAIGLAEMDGAPMRAAG
jgi:hypothetical protein